MSTGTFNFYNSWKEYCQEGVNNSSDTFIVLLTTSSYAPNSSTHTVLADITNEVSGSGYSRQTLTGVTSSQSGGTYTLDANDSVFTASGGTITARYWVLYNDTVASPTKPLVAWGLLDNTPADVSAAAPNTITVAWNASGIYTAA